MNATLRRARLRLFAIAALGVFSLSLLPLQLIGLFFVPQTTFGIQVDDQTLLITVDDPRVTKEGVHDGDQLDVGRMSYDDRVALFSNMTTPANWQAGRAIVVSVKSARFGSRTTRLKAFPESSPQPFEFRLAQWTDALIGVLWVLIGAVLVAVRPSAMTWGFYLFCLGLHPFSSLGDWLGPPWLTALLILGFCVIRALAYAGIIFFAARAPRGSAEGGWKYFELAALPLFLSLVVIYCYDSLPDVTGVPDRLDLTSLTVGIVYGIKAAVLIALFVKMIRSRGAERASMAWVFAGYAAFTAAIATWNFVLPHAGAGTFLHDAVFTFNTFGLAALPFFVAYAVVWHRAFGMGFITNRVLVYGFFIATLGMFFGIIDWLVSAELAFRSLGIGIALGAAFVAGLLMQSQYRRAIQLVDRIFLPQRYAAGVQLDRIREALRSGARHTDERFASDVADALGLASVAVFGRTGDGGFVREVSCGWSDADAWHVLPGDVLCRKLTRRPGLVRLTESDAGGIALPAATARPQMAIAVRRRGRIERAILIGSRRSGASLDGDEVRGLAAVFAGAAA